MPEKPFEIFEEDFRKVALDYLCFKKGIDTKNFNEKLLNSVLYSSHIDEEGEDINIRLRKQNSEKQSDKR